VSDPKRTTDEVSFLPDVKYPRTYTSGFPYIHDDGDQTLCKTCSFRPWAKAGTITSATVHIVRGGVPMDVAASLVGGRWVAPVQAGDVVTIEPGGIVDAFGETNGTQIVFS
jgi:hypothetical protein